MEKENILEVLISEKARIEIKGRTYEIGELSLKQMILLSKEIIRILVGFSKSELSLLKEGKTNLDDLLCFFGFLDEKKIAKLIGIILKEEDIEFLSENLNIQLLSEILAFVCEKTNLQEILKNVQRMVKSVQKQTSLSSSLK